MNRLRIMVDFVAPAEAIELLRAGAAGHELLFPRSPAASVLAKGEMDPQFVTADVAFGQPDTEAIGQAPKIRWVHVSSSGITRYDTAAFRSMAAARNIALTNSASVYNEPCAVHALSFMLAQARKLPLALKTRAASGTDAWNRLREVSSTLSGESVLIAGYGAIGKRLVELLGPFNMRIVGYRRKPRGDEPIPIITHEQLPKALAAADHVVNILPQSAETDRFFDSTRFKRMKPGAVFYNIGRGNTVDQDALVEALRSKHLSAAWLDVTDPEPLPDDHPLWAAPNCYITPHTAGGHPEEAKSLVRHFLNNLQRFVKGEPLLDRVM